MDSASHGSGSDESRDSKPAALLSEGLKGPSLEVPEKVASSGAISAAEALLVQDVGKKEAGQVKAQQQKPVLKKPDKLAPCPRCDSLDTKFCYYNNYNVNQPRHFCKNCQRYWTAGGTLRNVPVGAGRRKNKHGTLHARHASMPDPMVRLDSAGTAQPRPCLARGQSAPEPMRPLLATSSSSTIVTSIPRCQEKRSFDAITQTGSSTLRVEPGERHYIPAEPQMSISSDREERRLLNAEHGGCSEPDLACDAEKGDCAEASTSSAPGSSSQQDTPLTAHELQSMARGPATTLQPVCAGMVRPVGIVDGSGLWTTAPTPFGLYNGSWPYGYNVGWSGPPPGTPGTPICPPGGTLVTCQPGVGGITAWSAPPNGLFCWGSTIIPGMPTGLAGTPWMTPGWGGGWSLPWGVEAAAAAASVLMPIQHAAGAPSTRSSTTFPSRLPIRPVLSKHPRDRLELERVESSLRVPKMVRLDDPGSVPRSSVWTAVGAAENRLESSVTSGSNFKAFLPVVGDGKASVTSGDKEQAGAAL